MLFLKMLERLVQLQLTEYIESNVLLDERQSSYRANHSTETALLKTSMDLYNAVDTGCYVLL